MTSQWLYPVLEWVIVLSGLASAALFKPWAVLRDRQLQHPWLAAMVILPWAWWMRRLLPEGMALHASGACLLVLMFGWPLATWSVALIGLLASLIEALSPVKLDSYQHLPAVQLVRNVPELLAWYGGNLDGIVAQIAWAGVLPAALALGLGLLMRRFLPHHLFVFILGRGFFVTALAVSVAGLANVFFERVPLGIDAGEWMLAHWLLGWGEAFSTGMLVAIFVAFKPEWLLTYSDKRYLPPAKSCG
jgi:uncharacterized membrane protein